MRHGFDPSTVHLLLLGMLRLEHSVTGSFEVAREESNVRPISTLQNNFLTIGNYFTVSIMNIAGALPEQNDLDDGTLHEEFNWLRPLYARRTGAVSGLFRSLSWQR